MLILPNGQLKFFECPVWINLLFKEALIIFTYRAGDGLEYQMDLQDDHFVTRTL